MLDILPSITALILVLLSLPTEEKETSLLELVFEASRDAPLAQVSHTPSDRLLGPVFEVSHDAPLAQGSPNLNDCLL
jgi:hypothetical protein